VIVRLVQPAPPDPGVTLGRLLVRLPFQLARREADELPWPDRLIATFLVSIGQTSAESAVVRALRGRR
jgi:hypothetical protein